MCGGGLLVKNHGRRESRDAESKTKGGATTGFYVYECYFRFRVRKNILFILVFFFLNAGLIEPIQFGTV
jgi:hypothetical protein